MIRTAPVTATLCLALALAGCQRLGYGGSRPAALPATPTPPVSSQPLEPLDPVQQGQLGAPLDGTMPDGSGTQVASGAPLSTAAPAGAREIGRSDMLGGWSLASGSDNCKLFMTLTTWSGGYRANSRGCTSPALQKISAWDLQGKQVILKDDTGTTVAQLYATSAESFNGRASTGAPISVYR